MPHCNYVTFTIQSIAKCIILFFVGVFFLYNETKFKKTIDLYTILLLR